MPDKEFVRDFVKRSFPAVFRAPQVGDQLSLPMAPQQAQQVSLYQLARQAARRLLRDKGAAGKGGLGG